MDNPIVDKDDYLVNMLLDYYSKEQLLALYQLKDDTKNYSLERNKVTLAYVNALLAAIKAFPIDKLIDFKGIKRSKFTSVDLDSVVDTVLPSILKCYGKKEIDFYFRARRKEYWRCLLRLMLKGIGYKMTRMASTETGGINIVKYSIKKKA